MNKTYTITALEQKTLTTGKIVKNVTLKDDTGAITERVSIWSDFPLFATLTVGSSVFGIIYTNSKGYNTLYPPKAQNSSTGGFKRSGGNMTALMETKNENIRESQENKEHGIRISSTMNKAVELAIACYRVGDEEVGLEHNILKWREWLWTHWSDPDTKPNFGEPF